MARPPLRPRTAVQNVFKLFEAVETHGHKANTAHRQQVVFYDDGLGTESWKLLKFLGGAFGFGLSRNIRQLYTSVVRSYRPGDHIYLFGFSRGAFTVRSLVGFMMSQGLLDASKFDCNADLVGAVRFLYRRYRWTYRTPLQRLVNWFLRRSGRLAKRYALGWWLVGGRLYPTTPRIRFLGVWDTVDAVGFPIPCVAELVNKFIYRFKFPDLALHSEVELAGQALSIDDERLTFHPLVWDETGEKGDRLKQVWFAGAHCNVGGGYPKHGMSLEALDWMMTEAEAAGLRFIPEPRQCYRAARNAHDAAGNSRGGAALFYRYYPRDISKYFRDNGVFARIHVSVLERLAQLTEGYAPVSIPRGCEFVATQDGSAWPDKIRQRGAEISAYIAGALDDYAAKMEGKTVPEGPQLVSPLDLVRRYARARFVSHIVFLVAVIALVLIVIMTAWMATDILFPTSGSDWMSIARVLYDGLLVLHVPGLLALVLLGVVIPACTIVILWARRRMERVLSAFWHEVGIGLRCRLQ